MSFSVKVFQGLDAAVGAQIALNKHLYIVGWVMRHELAHIIQMRPDPDVSISIGYENDEAVCAALYNGTSMMAFCKPAARRNGYTSKCVRALRVPPQTTVGHGIPGSEKFWAHNNLKIDGCRVLCWGGSIAGEYPL